MKSSDSKYRGFFGSDPAVVMGLPAKFDLRQNLEHAREIKLATAFAHWSGWKLVRESVERSDCKLNLLTGLSFCQTDPKVLREWVELVKKRHRASARLYVAKGVTFHPKVLIVRTDKLRFAVVGSANLSGGGFQDNVECSVLLKHRGSIDQIESWYDHMFSKAQELTAPCILKYQPKYDNARRHDNAIRKAQTQIESDLLEQQTARFDNRKAAISACKKYFRSPHFKNWYPFEKRKAAKAIKKALNYPSFNFSKDGWDEFYAIGDLGSIRQSWKGAAWKQRRKLQEGFRQLIRDPVAGLPAILDDGGKFRVSGVGLNIISKVLIVHQPKLWPLYNAPIAETLRAFDYELPSGMLRSARYLAFVDMMRKFMIDSGAPDMLALDCFFYWYSKLRDQ